MHACSVTLIVSDSVTPWTLSHQTPLPPDLGESLLDKAKGDNKK